MQRKPSKDKSVPKEFFAGLTLYEIQNYLSSFKALNAQFYLHNKSMIDALGYYVQHFTLGRTESEFYYTRPSKRSTLVKMSEFEKFQEQYGVKGPKIENFHKVEDRLWPVGNLELLRVSFILDSPVS